MSTLPPEVSSLTQLEKVDISHNSFVSLPKCLMETPRLTHIDARKNFIVGENL
jgi:Leucine-rich repeat (LRR) protein